MSQQVDPGASQAADEPRAPSKLIPILVLLAGLAVGGSAGALVVGPKLAAPPAEGEHGEEGGGHGGGHGGKGSAGAFLIENLVVNPAGTDGSRFLILTIAVETKGESENQVLSNADARVRDAIGEVLGKRTVPELTAPEAREWLKAELSKVIADAAGLKSPVKVYLPQYVMQ